MSDTNHSAPIDFGPVEVAVVGSINLDLSVTVERFPTAGETVLGRQVLWGGGGKGANQAVAAARLGRRVAMIGRVGDDEAGTARLAALAAEGIDTSAVLTMEGISTGLAMIEVDGHGENRIVVAPGANGAVGTVDLTSAADTLNQARVILTQMEIPAATVVALAEQPRSGVLIVNPAPATPGYQVAGVDLLVPNRNELALLLGESEASTVAEVVDQIHTLAATAAGLGAVVTTIGAGGAVVVERPGTPEAEVTPVASVAVTPVDTTAAGDSFCGALADALCLGADVVDAVGWAVKVAAVTVTRRGAQDSLPLRAEVLV